MCENRWTNDLLLCGTGVAELIKMRRDLKGAQEKELPSVMARVRQILPQAKTRIQRSYAWLLIATLKVMKYNKLPIY